MNNQLKSDARTHMILSQIRPGHVLAPRILGALEGVARELFVPPALRDAAYVDQEIPFGKGRFLMEPIDFARMLKFAAIEEGETVLDIACATGYSSAVLAQLARRVVAVEEEESLAATAQTLLAAYPNVTFSRGPLAEGFSAQGPYDAILIGGAIETLPQPLADQLREGGRLLTAEHDATAKVGTAGLSKLVEYRKIKGALSRTVLRDANIARLPGFALPKRFTL